MSKHTSDYHAYMLRLWRTEETASWRASLEDAQTGKRVGFRSLTALCAFLREKTAPSLTTEKNAPKR